ncbi:unnamed protein product [Caenorhabditis angaria]|uniref:Glycosyltransferase family 92 protein n=1 Tax=Caenorhabditis angaria TaxID=860376 RepID=A0A9P1MZV3_9PELO|nr:unnamed protein product [Caenorhabditis angaria]
MFENWRLFLLLLLTAISFVIVSQNRKRIIGENESFLGNIIENCGERNSDDYFLAVEPNENIMNVASNQSYKEDYYDSKKCKIQDWNKNETNTIPNRDYFDSLIKSNVRNQNILLNKTPSPFSAYVYSDHIVVTLTSERNFSDVVFCRYYDCKMRELTGKYFESRHFPQSTVFCGRRIGAEYISITEKLEDEAEFPIRIIRRDEKKPAHYFTVCLAPIYGEEPKFLQIVDFIEYYKLQGATFFHIYVTNVSNYDRVLLDDYVRTGEVEIIQIHDHYWRADFMWHRVQINDCHFRNKYFSKWTAFLDIDERIEMKKYPELRIVDLLDETTPNVSTLRFSVDWVVKDQLSPKKYQNDEQLKENMIFRKFTNTSTKTDTFKQPKCIIRPERITIMGIHYPLAVYDNSKVSIVNYRIAAIRHYRNVFHKLFPRQVERMMEYGPWKNTTVAPWIAGNLTTNILRRVKYLYDIEIPSDVIKQENYAKEESQMDLEKIEV